MIRRRLRPGDRVVIQRSGVVGTVVRVTPRGKAAKLAVYTVRTNDGNVEECYWHQLVFAGTGEHPHLELAAVHGRKVKR